MKIMWFLELASPLTLYSLTSVYAYSLCPVVQWSEHWALSWTTQVLVLARARHCALEMRREKKVQAPLLGLAKSIYYYRFTAFHRCISVSCLCQDIKNVDIFILVSSQSDQHLISPYNITPGSHINPLTPMSDQDRISPYNINTVSSRPVMRIKINISSRIF